MSLSGSWSASRARACAQAPHTPGFDRFFRAEVDKLRNVVRLRESSPTEPASRRANHGEQQKTKPYPQLHQRSLRAGRPWPVARWGSPSCSVSCGGSLEVRHDMPPPEAANPIAPRGSGSSGWPSAANRGRRTLRSADRSGDRIRRNMGPHHRATGPGERVLPKRPGATRDMGERSSPPTRSGASLTEASARRERRRPRPGARRSLAEATPPQSLG